MTSPAAPAASEGKLPGFPATVCPQGQKDFATPLEERERAATFARLSGRPFGHDGNGRPIDQVSGRLVRAAVETLLEGTAPEARESTLAALVERLNSAIGDPRYHVTAGSLLDEGNRYSREMELFVNVYARELSGDRSFFWRRGANTIPRTLLPVLRPLSLDRLFRLAPQLTTRFLKADLRVQESGPTSGVLRWYSRLQQEGLPPELRNEWLQMSCPAFCGAIANVPALIHDGQAPSEIRASSCQRQGAEYCEWHVRWKNLSTPTGRGVLVGGLLSVGLVAAWAFLGVSWLAPVALLPLLLGWRRDGVRRLRQDAERQERLLLEQSELTQRLEQLLDTARGELQNARLERSARDGALRALAELSEVLAAWMPPDGRLRAGLGIVTANLPVDRVVAVLHDARQDRLAATALSGPSPELGSRLRTLEEPAGSGGSLLSDVFQSGKTARLTGETRVRRLSPLLSALGTREQLVVPLVVGGRPLGLLVADSPITGRPFEDDVVGLLEIVARLLAVSLAGERNAGTGPDV